MTHDESKYFSAYLSRLNKEVLDATTILELWIHLQDKRLDRLKELNVAPAFFGAVLHSMRTTVIVSLARLYDADRSERNLIRFVNYVEQHQDLFTTQALKTRRQLADDYWFLKQHTPIDAATIETHRRRIADLQHVISNLFTWRDKRFAHLDKDYFSEPSRLSHDFPLQYGQLRQLVSTAQEILNRYSTAFDGVVLSFDAINAFDVDKVLDILHRHVERQLNAPVA